MYYRIKQVIQTKSPKVFSVEWDQNVEKEITAQLVDLPIPLFETEVQSIVEINIDGKVYVH